MKLFLKDYVFEGTVSEVKELMGFNCRVQKAVKRIASKKSRVSFKNLNKQQVKAWNSFIQRINKASHKVAVYNYKPFKRGQKALIKCDLEKINYSPCTTTKKQLLNLSKKYGRTVTSLLNARTR